MAAPPALQNISMHLDATLYHLKEVVKGFTNKDAQTAGLFLLMFRNNDMRKVMEQVEMWQVCAKTELEHWSEVKDMSPGEKGMFFMQRAAEMQNDS